MNSFPPSALDKPGEPEWSEDEFRKCSGKHKFSRNYFLGGWTVGNVRPILTKLRAEGKVSRRGVGGPGNGGGRKGWP